MIKWFKTIPVERKALHTWTKNRHVHASMLGPSTDENNSDHHPNSTRYSRVLEESSFANNTTETTLFCICSHRCLFILVYMGWTYDVSAVSLTTGVVK